jgi:hypothetical protein
MPFPLLISVVLLGGAVGVRWLAASRPRLAQTLACGVILAGSLMLGLAGRNESPVGDDFWRNDRASLMVAAVTLVVLLVAQILNSNPLKSSAMLWSGGLLVFSGCTGNRILLWIAVQFSILPLFFYGRTRVENFRIAILRHQQLFVGSILFGAGTLLRGLVPGPAILNSIGWILVLCGLGGMLGWFPFPRAAVQGGGQCLFEILSRRVLPALTAAVSLLRDSQGTPLIDQQQFLFMVCAFFPFAICSIRLLFEERLSQRLVLSSLATLSLLVIAVAIESWQASHSSRDWSSRSNFPGGTALFLSILVCETLAWSTVACGFFLVRNEPEDEVFAQTLAGVCSCRPVASLPLLIGLCSLAGIPPFPGFWWRFGLISAVTLPHRQSFLTRIIEPHRGFIVLGIVLAVLLVINGLGHLKLIQKMLLEEPFRVRDRRVPVRVQCASLIATALLMIAAIAPISLGTERMTVKAVPAVPVAPDSDSSL